MRKMSFPVSSIPLSRGEISKARANRAGRCSGTPCISTDVTGIPEILRHGQTGLLVGQHDPAALADALARLLDDAALRVHLTESARRLIEAEFDAHRNATRIRELFGPAAGVPAALRAVS